MESRVNRQGRRHRKSTATVDRHRTRQDEEELIHKGVLLLLRLTLDTKKSDFNQRTEHWKLHCKLVWVGLSWRQGAIVFPHSTKHLGQVWACPQSFCTHLPASTYRDCQGCRWRSTWGWHQCLDRRAGAVCRSLLALLYPRELALPAMKVNKHINWMMPDHVQGVSCCTDLPN